MATWITHLRIADNLLPLIAGLDEEYFAIGNLAPDSGVPDENWENFEPPPSITHCLLFIDRADPAGYTSVLEMDVNIGVGEL
jgi:hypothetical protein